MEKNSFMTTKKIVYKDVLISYPNFSEDFIIHTNTSKTHLGRVMIQNRKPSYFNLFSQPIPKYIIELTERERLSIV